MSNNKNARYEYYKEWREKNKEKKKLNDKLWYEANKEKCALNRKKYNAANKEKIRLYNETRKKTNYNTYYLFMQDKQCNRCGYADYRALVWHHIDPSTKKSDISDIVRAGRKWEVILEEISKCECLCQNCHHIEHHPHKEPIRVDSDGPL